MPPVVLSTERSAASAYPLEDPRKGELAEPAQKAVAGDAGGARDFLSLVFGDAVASWAALVDVVAAANGLVSAEGLRAALRIAVEQDHSASMTESFQPPPMRRKPSMVDFARYFGPGRGVAPRWTVSWSPKPTGGRRDRTRGRVETRLVGPPVPASAQGGRVGGVRRLMR